MESLRRYKTIAFALAYSMSLAILLYGQLRDWAYDDPFITFRYAENLARGLGFVYNPGERVLSTTTPLFALLLAILSHSGLDLPHLANLIGALSLALGGLALWDLARTWKTPLVGWVGLLLYPGFSLLTHHARLRNASLPCVLPGRLRILRPAEVSPHGAFHRPGGAHPRGRGFGGRDPGGGLPHSNSPPHPLVSDSACPGRHPPLVHNSRPGILDHRRR